MIMKFVYKEEFSVIGKLGQGPAEDPWKWILSLWKESNSTFGEIDSLVRKKDSQVEGLWGIMSDFGETFARWDENGGKYLACCEVKEGVLPPAGWTKWAIPSQTYIVVRCVQEDYLNVFEYTIQEYIPENKLELIGAVHEFYPEPGNPQLLDLYFPISKGNYICQSCGMPLINEADLGTNADQTKNKDYCSYCYQNGSFSTNVTMKEMIEGCIPFGLEAGCYPDAESARESMSAYFPMLKRWKNV